MAYEGIFTWLPPVVELLVIAIVLSVAMTLAYKYLTDQAVMRELKAEISRLKKKMKEHRRDPEKMREVQKEMMPLNMKYFKLSMKPTLITLLPFLLIFMGLRAVYEGAIVIDWSSWGPSIPLIGQDLGWLGTYIIFSLVLTTVVRKALKVV